MKMPLAFLSDQFQKVKTASCLSTVAIITGAFLSSLYSNSMMTGNSDTERREGKKQHLTTCNPRWHWKTLHRKPIKALANIKQCTN